MKKRFVAHAVAVAAGFAMLVSIPAVAAAPQQDQHNHQAPAQQGGQPAMGQMKMDQMKMGQMKMQGNTERLNALMARVRSTTGDERTSAMADVIAILLEERAAMQEHCAAMCGKMQK